MAEPPTLEYQTPPTRGNPSITAWVSLFCAVGSIASCLVTVGLGHPGAPLVVAGLFGLVALVTGIIGLKETWGGRGNGQPAAIIGLLVGMMMAGFLVLLPTMGRQRPDHNQIRCSSNLRQIGQSMRMYAIDDLQTGSFPPDVEGLFANSDLVAGVMVCPSSNALAAPPPFTLGQNLSYVYLATGMTDSVNATTPVAYCQTHNHTGGTNVLYADGSVRFVATASYPPEVQPTTRPTNR